jgi:hypothetical protein
MAELPSEVVVCVRADGDEVEGVWVMVTAHAARRNDFRSAHGPSDVHGRVVITRTAIVTRENHDRSVFLMDYGSLVHDWTGRLTVRPMNREALRSALDAVDTWGAAAWAAPIDVRNAILAAQEVLDRRTESTLTVEVLDAPYDLDLVLGWVHA